MNSINLTGRLIHDPTRRDTNRGVVASFRLAVDGRPRVWIDVEAWGHLAGTVATYLTARRHVAITGRLAQHEYHDQRGLKLTRYHIVADRIGFLDAPTSSADMNETAPNGPDHTAPNSGHVEGSDTLRAMS